VLCHKTPLFCGNETSEAVSTLSRFVAIRFLIGRGGEGECIDRKPVNGLNWSGGGVIRDLEYGTVCSD